VKKKIEAEKLKEKINKPFVTIIGDECNKETIGLTHYGYLIINIDWKKRIVTMQEEII